VALGKRKEVMALGGDTDIYHYFLFLTLNIALIRRVRELAKPKHTRR
jgi:hypothetical protein